MPDWRNQIAAAIVCCPWGIPVPVQVSETSLGGGNFTTSFGLSLGKRNVQLYLAHSFLISSTDVYFRLPTLSIHWPSPWQQCQRIRLDHIGLPCFWPQCLYSNHFLWWLSCVWRNGSDHIWEEKSTRECVWTCCAGEKIVFERCWKRVSMFVAWTVTSVTIPRYTKSNCTQVLMLISMSSRCGYNLHGLPSSRADEVRKHICCLSSLLESNLFWMLTHFCWIFFEWCLLMFGKLVID